MQLLRFDVRNRLSVDHADYCAVRRTDDWFDATAQNKAANGAAISHAALSVAMHCGAGWLDVCLFHVWLESAGLRAGDAGAGCCRVFRLVRVAQSRGEGNL